MKEYLLGGVGRLVLGCWNVVLTCGVVLDALDLEGDGSELDLLLFEKIHGALL